MPRKYTPRRADFVMPIAVSPRALAEHLGIRYPRVLAATQSGALPVYSIGTKRRVLIVDAIAWVRTWNKA
jgi:hypothetical protein